MLETEEMIVLKITATEDGPAIVLNEEVRDLLGVAPGGEVRAEVSEGGQLTILGPETSPQVRRERGRAFIERYRKTFEALAK